MTQRRLKNGEAEKCPIRDILDRIGDRWSMLVLWSLARGTLRFSELKRNIGDISQRMLAQTLRRLEQDGLISRRIYPTVPPRVEYSLTPLGRSFLTPLDRLVKWADRHHARIRAARAAYAAAAQTERSSFMMVQAVPRERTRPTPRSI
ncbi:MAG TPA: helix-turn-helix domain-containing protein [Alphaproteobacteria bacterium]|nr:helix-turn-helix domain-containing protein [Alphaproteobacteria bacterium]